MKSYFALEDNVIDKQIQKYIDDQTFTSKKNAKNIIEQIIECYAENFTGGNKEKAQKIFSNENVQIRQKDAVLLAFFSGTLIIALFVTIATILMPYEQYSKSNDFDWEEMILTLPVFRFVFMIIFALALISLDVLILRKYRVNYMFIFDLDPNYKVTQVQLIRVSMMLLTIWMLCFMA